MSKVFAMRNPGRTAFYYFRNRPWISAEFDLPRGRYGKSMHEPVAESLEQLHQNQQDGDSDEHHVGLEALVASGGAKSPRPPPPITPDIAA